MVDWIKNLLLRIPRPMWQVGLAYKDDIQWGYVLEAIDWNLIRDEWQACGEDEHIELRRRWISPARLEKAGEFGGW